MTLNEFIALKFETPVTVNDLAPYLSSQVFFNVTNAPMLSSDASKLATPGEVVSVPVTVTPLGPMVVLFADASDVRLSRPFAGVLLDEAIQIVSEMPNVAGLILQGDREQALAIEKLGDMEVKHR